jgi:hypothetical protein
MKVGFWNECTINYYDDGRVLIEASETSRRAVKGNSRLALRAI